MTKASLHTDGGSRGNPGLAGLGFVLSQEGGEPLATGGWCLPHATNNVAEYSALIWGLENARAAGVSRLSVYTDSELMAKQINGSYKVKSADLKPLFLRAKALLEHFDEATVAHVYRKNNDAADALANEAMDIRAPVGYYLMPWDEFQLNLFGGSLDGVIQKTGEKPQEISELGRVGTAGYGIAAGGRGSVMEKNSNYEGPGKLSGSTYENVGGRYELKIKDHFDAAHILAGFDGPCRYLHGHTWEVEVAVCGHHLDEVGLLIDFTALKDNLHEVLRNFDHHYINDVPPFDAINPTAENLARVIYFELENTLPQGVLLHTVSVWESPHAKVVYRP
ncbi:MAG: 6-carboxytetrahydropterin synthase QueD [Eggerthellaceae bacterium]|jgi:queuosine biosynthesis protein QueD|nr:6-carboxytetrahydropterin synthase QueD [Eggerthellaceae bacterium]MDR2715623.1 6-carboxytetrahydropterin synthase QueD [Coriobacteriaceae bacterium]